MKRIRTHNGAIGAHTRRPSTDNLTNLARDLDPVVYFIRTQDDLIKVGYTESLHNRKRAYGSGWEHILAVTPGTLETERSWHERFAPHLERGREYFRPHPEVIAAINEIRNRLGVGDI